MNNLRVVSANLGNGTNGCETNIVDRKKTKSTTIKQAELLKSLDADFILIQELTRLTPMNMFVNTKDIFLPQFDEFNYEYFKNLYQFNGLLEHGKASLAKKAFKTTFCDHEISKDKEDYALINLQRKNGEITYLKKLLLFINAFILNNRSMIETSVNLNGGTLKIFNTHLIPFAANQNKRIWEIELIISLLIKEFSLGHHVILGGDFNFNFLEQNEADYFPDYLKNILKQNGFKVVTSDAPTHKLSLQKDNIKFRNLDGFIVSPNVDVLNITSLEDFELSDHSPLVLDFKLK